MPASIRIAALLFAVTASTACSTTHRGGDSNVSNRPRVLLVVTSQQTLGSRPDATGLFLSEASHPWEVFTEHGFEVVLASPSGGPAPIDPKSLDLSDAANRRFLAEVGVADDDRWRLADTRRLEAVDAGGFDAIFFAGGHGTMWDFSWVPAVRAAAESVHRSGGVVAAVCHGPAALVGAVDASGGPLVAGRRLTAFTDSEEAAIDLTEAMPFLLESRLRDLGGQFESAENFAAHVVVDDRIVTGQNPASATGTAVAVVGLVSAGS